MVMSTMTDMTDQVDIQNHFLISERVWQCCWVHHIRDTSSEWCC